MLYWALTIQNHHVIPMWCFFYLLLLIFARLSIVFFLSIVPHNCVKNCLPKIHFGHLGWMTGQLHIVLKTLTPIASTQTHTAFFHCFPWHESSKMLLYFRCFKSFFTFDKFSKPLICTFFGSLSENICMVNELTLVARPSSCQSRNCFTSCADGQLTKLMFLFF